MSRRPNDECPNGGAQSAAPKRRRRFVPLHSWPAQALHRQQCTLVWAYNLTCVMQENKKLKRSRQVRVIQGHAFRDHRKADAYRTITLALSLRFPKK